MNRLGRDGRTVSRLWSVRKWVASRMGNTRHERRVAAIASAPCENLPALHTLLARISGCCAWLRSSRCRALRQ